MDLFTTDNKSLVLALQLQYEELGLGEQYLKGKQPAGEVTEPELFLGTWRKELDEISTLVTDRALTLSIAHTINLDACPIGEIRSADDQAERDDDFAVRLYTDPSARPTLEEVQGKPSIDDAENGLIGKFRKMNIPLLPMTNNKLDNKLDKEDEKFQEHAESSGRAAAASCKQPETRPCLACTDPFPPQDLCRQPCSHEYCFDCLVSLVRSSLQDESLFPPRCCGQNVPIDPGRWFTPELVGEFRAKKIEYDTPNRIYCSEPTCSTFVPPQFITEEAARCPKCNRKTCVHCKGEYHSGICPDDSASQQVLQLATDNGWQRCFGCKRLVELKHGCNHITCICRAEFCYACGEPWKNCDCGQWHEQHLLRRAADIIDRDGNEHEATERAREARLAMALFNLRQVERMLEESQMR